ncbi:MAG: sulfatase-like hydrolase/transferase [Vicinamibacterales bacterium]
MSARRRPPRPPRPAPPTPVPARPRRVPGRALAAAVLVAVAALGAWWALDRGRAATWPAGALRGGNVLLVTIDTLRADRLRPDVMPGLSALADRGHRFTRAYSQAPLTLPSHSSILTGLRPPAHGVRGNGAFRLPDAQVTLAERLHDRGYRTGAFVGAFVLDPRFGLAQGFDAYDAVDDDRPFAGEFGFAERRAADVLAPAATWILGATSQPWFAWVHLFDPHAPYEAPGASRDMSAYDEEAHYADAQLTAFLDRLRAAGALDRTLVIVTADHGESLGEHGEQTHGLFAYDATMRVPLVAIGPGLGRGVHDQPATLIDIVPTVIETLGLPPDTSLPGRPLRDVAATGSDTRALYLEAMDGWLAARSAPVTAVVADGWKLVEVPDGELYDLRTDPGETDNLWSREPTRRRELEARLAELTAGPRAASTAPAADSEAEARLRALGYASGGAPPPDAGARFSQADDPKVVLPVYERFLDLIGAGQPDPAALLAIVAKRPSFEAARLAAASMLIDGGRPDEAIAALQPAASAPGASLALRERLGAALLAAGRPDDAVSVLADASTDPGASADAWNALGVARAQTGDPAGAQAAFDRAVTLAPASARFRFNRALAHLQSGDIAAAEADLVALTGTAPGMADGWRLLATLRHRRGDLRQAVDAWRHVAALAPDDTDTLFNLAVTLRDLGDTEEAGAWAAKFDAAIPPGSHPAERRELASLLPSR